MFKINTYHHRQGIYTSNISILINQLKITYLYLKLNERPQGHTAPLSYSINTVEKSYNYMITLIRKKKTHSLLFENGMALPLNKLEFPLPKDALCQIWLLRPSTSVSGDC